MIGVPVVVMVFLRINAAMVFLGLALGSLLVRLIGPEATNAVQSSGQSVPQHYLLLGLLFAPAVIIAVTQYHSLKSKSRQFINILPALATGAVGLLLSLPYFSPHLRGQISHTHLSAILDSYRWLVIAAGAILSLLLFQKPAKKAKADDDTGKKSAKH